MQRDMILRILRADMAAARKWRAAAARQFAEFTQKPGIASPEQIQQASRRHSEAVEAVTLAGERLDSFLHNGIVPTDLQMKTTERKPAAKVQRAAGEKAG
ncbi:MAG TPA: hypothetical protein VJN43_11040 [Bryobacteraceae bacterium]|nr:hypothetical protein [Bryobacteraceae bacterium]